MRRFLSSIALAMFATSAAAINVTISSKPDGNASPTIMGTTNLPEGVELIVELERKDIQYRAQTKTLVQSGKFQAGPFSFHGANLNPGLYKVHVSMSLARFQPESTWARAWQRRGKSTRATYQQIGVWRRTLSALCVEVHVDRQTFTSSGSGGPENISAKERRVVGAILFRRMQGL